MAAAVLVGRLVRERRLALGLRQAAVAEAAGISAAYLNLIEHDRRRVGAAVLARLAGVLDVAPAVLGGGPDAARLDEIRGAAAEGGLGADEVARAAEVMARYPAWAGLVAGQARRVAVLERAVAALNDRIGTDPRLSAALYEVLATASAVRSTAAILAETEEIDPGWRARFHANLHEDSERLARGTAALVAWLDIEAGAEAASAGPQDEVEAWLGARGWHLPEVEPDEAGGGAGGGAGAAALAGEVAAIPSAAGREMAAAHVARAAAEAGAMPLSAFVAAADRLAGDPVLLAAAFGVPVLAAMRRLALRPGAAEGLVVCDAAGALVFRKGVAGFPMPRAGHACARWPLFAALGRPGLPVAAMAEAPGLLPQRFRLSAFAEAVWPAGFGGAEVRHAGMLISAVAGAEAEGVAVPVGATCRICPQEGCPVRREPSILALATAPTPATRF